MLTKVCAGAHTRLWFALHRKRLLLPDHATTPRRRSPHTTCSQSAVAVGPNRIIVFGGTAVPFGEINSNELTEFTVADGTWRALGRLNDGEPAPMRRFGQAMVCDGHAIWVVGGTDGHEFYADVWKFDLEMLSWEWCHPGVVGDDDPFVPQGRCETTPTPFEIRPCRHSSSGRAHLTRPRLFPDTATKQFFTGQTFL